LRPDSRRPPLGFFSEDTRFVSRWELTIGGRPTDTLSTPQPMPSRQGFAGAPTAWQPSSAMDGFVS
jgi:hypothetical protein